MPYYVTMNYPFCAKAKDTILPLLQFLRDPWHAPHSTVLLCFFYLSSAGTGHKYPFHPEQPAFSDKELGINLFTQFRNIIDMVRKHATFSSWKK